ncbi:hypothetical protein LCGC14_1065620 [marine sediment metagenome]|uniref:Uncharacterized protein n=1 Tax=marine sediment metagenome TaxID=412755 RepID=A0A0F9MJR3_9ZZZZ
MLSNVGLSYDIEDAAIVPVPNSDIVQVKNIDILTPIVDEPEIMGEIAACNVTNDIFALNVPKISGMLAFLGINAKTPMKIAERILIGIKNFVEKKINSHIVGGHTIYSEWPLMGGEASGFVKQKTIITKQGVKDRDKLLLTKPIGLQPTMAAYRVLKERPELLEEYSKKEIRKSIKLALKIMTTSNQDVVKVIRSFKDFSFIHAMTDVTGFGLAGHLLEMLQHSNLSALIETLPSIKHSEALSNDFGYAFDVCKSAETAGGMLIAINPSKTEEFSMALSNSGISNWCVGTIDKVSPGLVRISENVKNIEVTKY